MKGMYSARIPRRVVPPRVGGPFDFLGGIGDLLTSIADRVPGGRWIRENANDAVKSLASTTQGQVILGVISASMVSGAFTALAPVVGPQAASAAFALPGVLNGDSASKAWVDGFTLRLSELAQRYGADQAQQRSDGVRQGLQNPDLSAITPDKLNYLRQWAGTPDASAALAAAGITPEALAAKYGGAPEDFAWVLNGKTKTPVYDINQYDLRTGTASTLFTPGVTTPKDTTVITPPSGEGGGLGGDSIAMLPGGIMVPFTSYSAAAPSTASKVFRSAVIALALTAPLWLTYVFQRLPLKGVTRA